VPRRPAPDGERVDPRDDQRDEPDPENALEVAEEPEAEAGHQRELREVGERIEVGGFQDYGQDEKRAHKQQKTFGAAVGEYEVDEPEDRRDQTQSDKRQLPPLRELDEILGECVVQAEGNGQQREGADSRA
jgi:hypothetical protein